MDGINVRAPKGFYDCRIKAGQKLNLAEEPIKPHLVGEYENIVMLPYLANASIIRPVKKRKIKN